MGEEIRRLAGYMGYLGIEINVDNFASRIKLQKFAYILGVLLDDKLFNFGFYIRGPYSRSLAREYYGNKELFEKDSGQMPSREEKEILDRIRPIAIDLGPTELEIIASLLYLEKADGLNEDDAIKELVNRKGYLKMENVVRALNKLKQLLLSKKEEERLLALLNKEMKPFDDASSSDAVRLGSA